MPKLATKTRKLSMALLELIIVFHPRRIHEGDRHRATTANLGTGLTTLNFVNLFRCRSCSDDDMIYCDLI